MAKLDEIDLEFHGFLDERPIYDPELIEFNRQTVRAYARTEADKFRGKLEKMTQAHYGTDRHLEASRLRDKFMYSIIDNDGSVPTSQAIQYRKEAQAARDTELGIKRDDVPEGMERVVTYKSKTAIVTRIVKKAPPLSPKVKTFLAILAATTIMYVGAACVGLYNHYQTQPQTTEQRP